MADIVVGTIRSASNASLKSGIAAVVLATGDSIYKTTGTQLALTDATVSAAAARFDGIVVHGGQIGDAISYQGGGDIDLGAALTFGMPLYVSETPGKLADAPPATTGSFLTQVGLNLSTSQLRIGINATGVQVP